MMCKKGVSIAVAWVLILGLSITLAVFVGVWIKGIARDTGESLTLDAKIDARCSDTVLGVEVNCFPGSDDFCGTDGDGVPINCKIEDYDIVNRGAFSIIGVRCFGDLYIEEDEPETFPLLPQESGEKVLSSCNSENNLGQNQVLLVPQVIIDEEIYGCAGKIISLNC